MTKKSKNVIDIDWYLIQIGELLDIYKRLIDLEIRNMKKKKER